MPVVRAREYRDIMSVEWLIVCAKSRSLTRRRRLAGFGQNLGDEALSFRDSLDLDRHRFDSLLETLHARRINSGKRRPLRRIVPKPFPPDPASEEEHRRQAEKHSPGAEEDSLLKVAGLVFVRSVLRHRNQRRRRLRYLSTDDVEIALQLHDLVGELCHLHLQSRPRVGRGSLHRLHQVTATLSGLVELVGERAPLSDERQHFVVARRNLQHLRVAVAGYDRYPGVRSLRCYISACLCSRLHGCPYVAENSPGTASLADSLGRGGALRFRKQLGHETLAFGDALDLDCHGFEPMLETLQPFGICGWQHRWRLAGFSFPAAPREEIDRRHHHEHRGGASPQPLVE